MTQNRFGKIILLSLFAISIGFFLFSCERPGETRAQTDTVNKLAEQVETVTVPTSQPPDFLPKVEPGSRKQTLAELA